MTGERVVFPTIEVDEIRHGPGDPAPNSFDQRSWRVGKVPACGTLIHFVSPGGSSGSVPCDLPPGHEGDCDSSQLLVRPADAFRFPAWSLGQDD
jgi:hypothetical protein